jgi:hypothetical protein
MAKKKQTKKPALKKTYEPTPAEQSVIEDVKNRVKENAALKLKAVAGQVRALEPDHPDKSVAASLYLKTFGTGSFEFAQYISAQLSNMALTKGDEVDTQQINGVLAALNGIGPQDELETLLAAQMVGVHNLAMNAMYAAQREGQTVDGAERNANRAVKLTRTFAAQMEALKKYRAKGQQIKVEHVHVNQGGQAIVGNVTKGGEV